MKTLTCKRCGHNWTSKLDNPKACPKCKSYYWQKPVMKLLLVALLALSTTACTKKPDAPAPQQQAQTITPPQTNPSQPPTPPPVTNCTGATVMYSMPVDTQTDNTIKNFVIPGFEISCGDTLTVLIRNILNAPTDPWTTLHDDPAGSSYYTVTNQTVSVHNNIGNTVYVEIEAVLK